jgi:hypothetical protein
VAADIAGVGLANRAPDGSGAGSGVLDFKSLPFEDLSMEDLGIEDFGIEDSTLTAGIAKSPVIQPRDRQSTRQFTASPRFFARLSIHG